MKAARPARKELRIAGERVLAGERRDLVLRISETYTGLPVGVPVRVYRAKRRGPVVCVTGAVHGDELNGTGSIRELLLRPPPLVRGALVCVPVVNVFGFENHSRYLPDRRDLNRSFPGKPDGSLADRLAHALFSDVVSQCDVGIELHTAAARRTNFPNVRGDLRIPEVKRLARAFGWELILDVPGIPGTLRTVATEHGVPTILLEAGEPLKFQPAMIEIGIRGVHNVLRELDMIEGEPEKPPWQAICQKSRWVRASNGGLLRFHVAPGDVVGAGSVIADCDSLFGGESREVTSPIGGIVVGTTTLPAVKPGEPVCHVAIPDLPLREIRRVLRKSPVYRRAQVSLSHTIALSAGVRGSRGVGLEDGDRSI